MESIIYVGIDVHKDTYSLCSFDMQKDLFFSQHTIKASTVNVVSYLKKISESNGNAITVCGYEAGPTGYRLCLDLQRQGFNCVIMAPTSIAKTAKDKMLKTDRADAQMLARTLAYHSYKQVVLLSHGQKSRRLLARQEGMDSEIINYADRAALRIKSRMRKLELRGLNYNKAAVACARELACFAWGMMTNHIQ